MQEFDRSPGKRERFQRERRGLMQVGFVIHDEDPPRRPTVAAGRLIAAGFGLIVKDQDKVVI
jgi:hypothetical protein